MVQKCKDCPNSYPTAIGLGMHRKQAHPDEYNADIPVSKIQRFTEEEVRLIAKAEAKKILEGGDPFMNIYLQSIFPERSRESLNRLRNRSVKWDYKGYVRKPLDELRNAQILATVEAIE